MQVGAQLLRVLLVDDEPFTRKGLAVLIDWEAEGYQIIGEASDGNSTIKLLKQNEYDLIISKTAIQYGCNNYILKPIQKDEILLMISKKLEDAEEEAGREKYEKDFEKAYLDRSLMAILWGKFDVVDMQEAILIRSFRFNRKNENKILKKETDSQNIKNDILRKQLDDLAHYIDINDKFKIKENAKVFYKNLMDKNVDTEVVSRTIGYLLYKLLDLAYKKDADIDQEEIMQYIRETVFSTDLIHENIYLFQQFVLEYADYLSQLKLNTATSIIDQIDHEIEEKYAESLSLKSLGEKYYINSAYLGQIFKKKYGCSFKDYLNNVRVRKAAELLLNTDKKVYEIAMDVGYKNQEYFINKFEEIYKVTPTRLRKRNLKLQNGCCTNTLK